MQHEVLDVPRYLEQPEKLLFFTLPQIACAIGPFAILLVVQQAILGLCLSALVIVLSRWLKKKGALETVKYTGYRLLPFWALRVFGVSLRATPPSSLNVLAG